MTRKKEKKIGEKLGYITIVDERSVRGQRKFTLRCSICNKKKEIWHSQYSSGNWCVCEHDAI